MRSIGIIGAKMSPRVTCQGQSLTATVCRCQCLGSWWYELCEVSRCLCHHAREDAEDSVALRDWIDGHVNEEFLRLQFEEEPLCS